MHNYMEHVSAVFIHRLGHGIFQIRSLWQSPLSIIVRKWVFVWHHFHVVQWSHVGTLLSCSLVS